MGRFGNQWLQLVRFCSLNLVSMLYKVTPQKGGCYSFFSSPEIIFLAACKWLQPRPLPHFLNCREIGILSVRQAYQCSKCTKSDC